MPLYIHLWWHINIFVAIRLYFGIQYCVPKSRKIWSLERIDLSNILEIYIIWYQQNTINHSYNFLHKRNCVSFIIQTNNPSVVWGLGGYTAKTFKGEKRAKKIGLLQYTDLFNSGINLQNRVYGFPESWREQTRLNHVRTTKGPPKKIQQPCVPSKCLITSLTLHTIRPLWGRKSLVCAIFYSWDRKAPYRRKLP